MKWKKKVFVLALLVAFAFNLLHSGSIITGSTKLGITPNASVSYNRNNACSYANYYSNKFCHDGTYRILAEPYYGYATCSTLIDDSIATGDCAHFVSCCIGNHSGYCSYNNSFYPGGGLSLGSDASGGSYGECNSLNLAKDLLNNGYAVSVSPVDELEAGDVIIYNTGNDLFDTQYTHHCVLYYGDFKVHAHSNHTSPGSPADWWGGEYVPGGANTALFFKIGYKYSIGCWVRVPPQKKETDYVKVRDSAGENEIGQATGGAIGQIIDGPVSAYLSGKMYQWYKVKFESGYSGSGWVASYYLRALENPHLFHVNDRVIAIEDANCRQGPGKKESSYGLISTWTYGTVIDTATYSDLNYSYDDSYTWVKIKWDNNNSGWFAQYYLEKVSINNPPTLSSGTVSPSSGTTSTTFTYSANYYDPEGASPTTKYVYIDGTAYLCLVQVQIQHTHTRNLGYL
ncbi:MAG: hypothetical protein KBG04_05270 [Bacteroidales bacterium]|nr:hypothetical protein [Bacteroidales bacterium]